MSRLAQYDGKSVQRMRMVGVHLLNSYWIPCLKLFSVLMVVVMFFFPLQAVIVSHLSNNEKVAFNDLPAKVWQINVLGGGWRNGSKSNISVWLWQNSIHSWLSTGAFRRTPTSILSPPRLSYMLHLILVIFNYLKSILDANLRNHFFPLIKALKPETARRLVTSRDPTQ